MDTVLVTGGAGYIGSQTCKALKAAGFSPITYDNLSTGHRHAVKWGPFVQGDLRDKETLLQTIKKFKPIAVLHFAADAIVHESVANPGKYYNNNFVGSLVLLEAMRDAQISHIIFSSTCAVYGRVDKIPITEKQSKRPINPYGRSKWMIEQMIADFEKAHSFKSVILRYFNVAGSDLEGEIGENHNPETHLIPSVIEAALGLRKEMVVYGTDFPTEDGSAIRDYVHIQDLADAHVKALIYLLKNQESQQINLGTGKGLSVLEIIETVKTFSKRPLPIKKVGRRAGDPPILAADNKLAKTLLNWSPIHSNILSIIESAWRWHEQQLSVRIP